MHNIGSHKKREEQITTHGLLTVSFPQAFLAATVFGRDEEDSGITLRQADVDVTVTLTSELLGVRLPMPFPLQPQHSKAYLDIR